MFRLNQGSPLLLFQIKSVETRLPCCVVHWSGAAGDIWPTGPMLTLSDLRMSTFWCRNPGMVSSRVGVIVFLVLSALVVGATVAMASVETQTGGNPALTKFFKARTGARGWVTRASNALRDVVAQPEVDPVDLQDAVDEFDKRLAALDEVQANVELELEENQLDADIETSAAYREKARIPRLQAAKRLVVIAAAADTRASVAGSSRASVEQSVNLPKLELPRFNGDVTEWQGFWDKFSAVIHDSDIPDINKFTYLQSLLDGEAKAAVQGLSVTAAHYKIACDILKERFGRKERIIFAHIQELLNMSVLVNTKNRIAALWKLQDDLKAHVRSLEALDVNGSQYGVILTPLILSRLPQDIRLEWAREGEGRESDLAWLLDFLNKEIRRRERSATFRESSSGGKSEAAIAVPEKRNVNRPITAAALQINSEHACAFCGKRHATERCWDLAKLGLTDRKDKIQSLGLCFRCLKKGHVAKGCVARCGKCKGRHHALLCNPNLESTGSFAAGNVSASAMPQEQVSSQSNPSLVDNSNSQSQIVSHVSVTCNGNSDVSYKHVILQCAKVKIRGSRGMVEANVLFDTGSDRSYITSSMVNKVAPTWVNSEEIAYAAFGTSKPSQSKLRNVYNVCLSDNYELLVTEVPVICSSIQRPAIPVSVLQSFGNVEFADCYDDSRHINIDILIGLDAYWKFIKSGVITIPEGLVAQQTVFGWIVSGSLLCGERSSQTVSHQLLCINDISETSLHKLWDLDTIGCGGEGNVISDSVHTEFLNNIVFTDGRYEVALPWKPNSKNKLLNNEKLAKIRLSNLSRKLSKDPELQQRYDEALSGMESEGVIEEVPPCDDNSYPVFYMPHRPVVREASVSTKVRPVFDASAHGYNGISLNECMETGPNLLPNLVDIILRFRRWYFAITADITKAFLQINVREQDRDVHRFLWGNAGQHRVMRFVRVPFGNKCSPFLLNATIKHHLNQFPESQVVKELKDNFYVDDWLSGADTDGEACDMMVEARDIMKQAGMSLTKWGSNSKFVCEKAFVDFGDKCMETDCLKILGMKWNATLDCFTFDGVCVPSDLVITKRVMLSCIARLFDPIGFLSPYVMSAKIAFQDVWKLAIDWDDEVPSNIQSRFSRWLDGLREIKLWNIPRSYTGSPWRDNHHVELHAFGDASERGYGACVYLVVKMQDGSRVSSLVMSKCRVAPIKVVTVPRLELLGATLCARLLDYVRKALKLPADVSYYCWSDSMVVLSWIRSDASRWKAFVCHRVSEIQGLTCPDRWRHCPGEMNPADMMTRGMHAGELMQSSLWLQGPDFLCSGGDDALEPAVNECGVEECIPAEVSLMSVTVDVLPVERWGSFTKCIRVIAWMLRFVSNSKRGVMKQAGELTYDELHKAKMRLFQYVQQLAYPKELEALGRDLPVPRGSAIVKLDPFVDADGLLRVKGRLQFADLSHDAKHPIILPKCHMTLLLIRFQHVFMKHAGVGTLITALRGSYWIVGVRRLAKQVKRECMRCQRMDVKACIQPMPPLPKNRVIRAPPFSVVGIDYAGPLYCCDFPRQKFYVLLFTCAVVRAVHLELVNSLNMENFVLALRRFAARRGMPTTIYSDNAKTFQGAQMKLVQHFGPQSPKWQFIAPRSPWWGGWWERLVASIKSALKKSVATLSLTRAELETNLFEVEACVNSRPLTYVGEDVDMSRPLTPSHFLIGRGSAFQQVPHECNHNITADDLVLREHMRTQALDTFWAVWRDDYIRHLPPYRGQKVKGHVGPGSVVLIREDGCPRLFWPLGLIIKVFPGRDGVIRAAEVKTKSSVVVRPVQRLHCLELGPPGLHDLNETPPDPGPMSNDVQTNDLNNTQDVPTPPIQMSRYGRISVPPERLHYK